MIDWVSILLRIISYDLKPHGMTKGENSQHFLNLENSKKTKSCQRELLDKQGREIT